MNYEFSDYKGLQVTHIEALNPFNSKLITLTSRGGLRTFSAILALCVACPVRTALNSHSQFFFALGSYDFLAMLEGKIGVSLFFKGSTGKIAM